MTATIEAPEVTEHDENDEDGKGGRDFTKVRQSHIDLATYVNEHSGLPPVSPYQVKAIQALRTDFNKLPEQVAARAARKAEIEAEKKKYEGMSPEQIRAAKQSKRALATAERMQAKAAEAMAKAEQLKAAAAGDGEALAALVEAQTKAAEEKAPAETAPKADLDPQPQFIEPVEEVEDEKPRRGRLGRSR